MDFPDKSSSRGDTPISDRITLITAVALLAALVERLLSWDVSSGKPGAAIFFLLFSTILWNLIVAVFVGLFSLASRLGKTWKWLTMAIAGVFGFVIVALDFAGWYFFSRYGTHLTVDAIWFGLQNFAHLQLHFLQTGAIHWLGFVLFSGGGCLALVWAAHRIAGGRIRAGRSIRMAVRLSFYGLIVLAAFLAWSTRNQDGPSAGQLTGWYDFHPFLYMAHDLYPESASPAASSVPLEEDFRPREKKAWVAPDRHEPAPVIVLMLESMRWDIVDHEPCPVPFMRSLREHSFVFDKAYTPSSHSDYADLSIWYSRYPLRFERRLNSYDKGSAWRGDSIFSVFKRLGYRTAYISSQNEKWGGMINWLKIPEVDYFFHSEDTDKATWENADDREGLIRLIQKKVATAGKLEDSETLAVARRWISGLDSKRAFFLGMNLQNTHYSYVMPQGGKEPFQPSVIDFPTVYGTWPREKVEHVRNRYYNAFYNLDGLVRDFVSFLKAEGIWDRCYFVIIGDSGEAFYEHGRGNHSGPMYDETVRTFTLIKPPQGVDTHPVDTNVSLIDILPTLLDLMKIPAPGSFQGLSSLSGPRRENVFLHCNGMIVQDVVVAWPWKLMATTRPYVRLELYNLENDPAEQRNVAPERKDVAVRLLGKRNQWRVSQLGYYRSPTQYMFYDPPKPL